MKNKILIISLALSLILTACASESPQSSGTKRINKNIPIVQIDADTAVNVKELNELENNSQLIVKGVLHDDGKVKFAEEGGTVLFGITVSSLEITETYKGNLSKGDIVKLGEAYYTTTEDGADKLYCFGNYRPSEIGKEYLFFLKNPPSPDGWWAGIYEPVVGEKGRYPFIQADQKSALSSESFTNEELNLGDDDSSEYKDLFNQVIKKYMQ